MDPSQDSREERALRMWVNSLGFEDMYVTDLCAGMRDSITLLAVIDKVNPGSVSHKSYNKVGRCS